MHRRVTLLISVILIISGAVSARGNAPERKNRQRVERIVAADPRVQVTACVLAGNFTVHGWDRKEVQARITDGVQIELTRIDQTNSQPARELKLTANGNRTTRRSSCLMFGDIELNVPRGASLKLQTNNGAIDVTDVARVSATSTSGSIHISKVREEADLNTIGGEISARDSTGTIKLHSVGGSIEARDLGEATATDILDADTTGGEITLERIQHKRVRAVTVGGEIAFAGPLVRGGRYSFQGISGRLQLTLPANSSFRLSGSIGSSGNLTNEFSPKDDFSHSQNGSMRRLYAVVGSGDASISISVFSGSVQIRKQ